MFSMMKINKNLIYILFFLMIVYLFGFRFLISFLGNVLILITLIPILIILIALISFNSLKSKLNVCEVCGTVSLVQSEKCLNCGANLKQNNPEILKKASETTIEVKAEEIK